MYKLFIYKLYRQKRSVLENCLAKHNTYYYYYCLLLSIVIVCQSHKTINKLYIPNCIFIEIVVDNIFTIQPPIYIVL